MRHVLNIATYTLIAVGIVTVTDTLWPSDKLRPACAGKITLRAGLVGLRAARIVEVSR